MGMSKQLMFEEQEQEQEVEALADAMQAVDEDGETYAVLQRLHARAEAALADTRATQVQWNAALKGIGEAVRRERDQPT